MVWVIRQKEPCWATDEVSVTLLLKSVTDLVYSHLQKNEANKKSQILLLEFFVKLVPDISHFQLTLILKTLISHHRDI